MTENKEIVYATPSIEVIGIVAEQGFSLSGEYPGGDVENNTGFRQYE